MLMYYISDATDALFPVVEGLGGKNTEIVKKEEKRLWDEVNKCDWSKQESGTGDLGITEQFLSKIKSHHLENHYLRRWIWLELT